MMIIRSLCGVADELKAVRHKLRQLNRSDLLRSSVVRHESSGESEMDDVFERLAHRERGRWRREVLHASPPGNDSWLRSTCRTGVFIDGSGIATDLIRQYGTVAAARRVHDHAPHPHWLTITFVAALPVDRSPLRSTNNSSAWIAMT